MGKAMEAKRDTRYAHNPHYCMIMPDAEERDGEDIVTGSQS